MEMEARMKLDAAPKVYQLLATTQAYVDHSGLDHRLLELVKMRASQINGCAFCLDMHSKDARAMGETEQRLYALNAWREAPFYTDQERAALEWTEAITLIAETHAPDEVYDRVKQHFTPEELANLTLAITTINSWNRLAIAFRAVPGAYTPNVEKLKASSIHTSAGG
jgi:AhpD family alkylhydroperoxidase